MQINQIETLIIGENKDILKGVERRLDVEREKKEILTFKEALNKDEDYFKKKRIIVLYKNSDDDLYLHNLKLFVYRNSIFYQFINLDNYTLGENSDNEDYLKKLSSLVNCGENLENQAYVEFDSKFNIKLNEGAFVEYITKKINYFLVYHKGTEKQDIYIYQNGVYNISSISYVKSKISSYIPANLHKDKFINCVYNSLLYFKQDSFYSIEKLNKEVDYINIKNGLYSISQNKLIEHNPKILSTLQLNCNYVEYKEPKKWLAYLSDLCKNSDETVDKDKIELLQEWLGLIISNIPVYKVKACLVLYSSLGNTGKSIFLNIISEFLGSGNTVNIPMQKLSDNFSLSGAYGKRAIIVGDQQAENIKDSSIFKQLTGGDHLEVEFKGKTKFSYVFNGAYVIACNDLPNFTDDKGGHIFERLCIVPCTNTIPKHKRNPNLFNELLEEKDLIFMWALEGLKRLLANNFKFTPCKASEEANNEFRQKNDTLFNFIQENYIITDDKMDRVKKTDFEEAYLKWCNENERNPVHKRNIKERMDKIGCGYKKSEGNHYYQCLKPLESNLEFDFENFEKIECKELPEIFR